MPADLKSGVAIGVDAGGSKTVGVLVDINCNVIERVVAGGANVRSAGRDAAETNIGRVLTRLSDAGEARSVCVGAAGIERDEDRKIIESIMARYLPKNILVALCNDAQIALYAGTAMHEKWGPATSFERPALVVIAGTGSFVYGERIDDSAVRAGGYGAVIGDEGSAYAIGSAAIRHTARALDGVDGFGKLAELVAKHLGVRTVAELISHVHKWPPDIAAIAALAPYVGEAYEADDEAAGLIVVAQGGALAEYAHCIARKIRCATVLPVVLAGGAFTGIPALAGIIRTSVDRTGPCEIRPLTVEPVLGAAQIALKSLKTKVL